MIDDIVDGFAFGGDYNPEQWTEDVWIEDMKLMSKAGVNLVSLGIFSWAKLEPEEGRYDFTWLDRVMNLLAEYNIKADLATATAAQPNWMSVKYPQVMAVDEKGLRYTWGSRQAYCPNSPIYRLGAAAMTRMLAEHYAAHPALAMWHVNNEYACHVQRCYCDICAAEFRVWLEKRYGDLDGVNETWGTAFWSQNYSDWAEVMPPRYTSTFRNPNQQLDYDRFMSDSILSLFTAERDILHQVTPNLKVTTNFMPLFKPLDYWKWAEEIDIISWDSYPDPHDPSSPVMNAFDHDLMRSLGAGKPFMLMEQAAGRVNWRPVNGMKHEGMMRFHSFQALSHGADAVMFFQWRQSRRGSEQFHSAMLPHAGEGSRTFTEITRLGAELKALSSLAGSRIETQVGLFFDYDSWWASEMETAVTAAYPYVEEPLHWYRSLRERNIPVDMVSPNTDFSSYKVLIMPRMFVIDALPASRLESWVEDGGVLLLGPMSAWLDGTGAIHPGGAPGPLRMLTGIRVEDVDPLPPGTSFSVDFGDGRPLAARNWREEIYIEGAEVLAVYIGGPMNGRPAVTAHIRGRGQTRYVSFRPDTEAMDRILDPVLERAGVTGLLETPPGVYASRRIDGDGRGRLFLLREGEGTVEVRLPVEGFTDAVDGRLVGEVLTLGSWDVRVLNEPD
jgi:beta-galactosidase